MIKGKKWFSPHNSQRRIGSLIEVSATEAKINLTKAGTGEQVWLLGKRISIGEVNQYIFIDAGEDTILAKVIKVWLEGSERLSVDNINDGTPNNSPLGIVQLLSSIDAETGYNHRGIRQYPKLGAQVYSAHPQLVSLLAQGSINKENEIELPIAEMPNDSTVDIFITPEKLFARHCAVLGATGGGKSYSMANLIENVENNSGKALLIDATGEYKDLPCESYYVGAENNKNIQDDEKTTYPHWMFTNSDLRALLRPSAQSQAPKLEEAIRSLKIVEFLKTYPDNRITTQNNRLLIKAKKNKAKFEEFVNQKAISFNNFKWLFSALPEQIVEECVKPPWGDKTEWQGIADNDVGYCLNLISRIQAMSNNEHLKWMLDSDPRLTTIPDVIENFLSSDEKILRLDLSAVPFEANAREILVNAIGRKLLELARKQEITNEKPLLVFIDEAHQFLNKKIGDDTTRVELDAFGNIAKEGRKYGLNVVIATQRPRDIPEDVLSQIGTLIVHRLSNQHDQDIVKKAVGSIDYRSASFLPILGQGEALLLGVDFPFPMVVKIKKPKNEPKSKSTNYSSVWSLAQWDI